jgi:hypothetical protein
LTFKIDFNTNRIAYEIDGLEAIKQTIYLTLRTDRYKYLIYSFNYGNELYEIIGKEKEFVEIETKRCIREALLQDDRIQDVTDYKFTWSNRSVLVTFTVHTNIGILESEVNIDV